MVIFFHFHSIIVELAVKCSVTPAPQRNRSFLKLVLNEKFVFVIRVLMKSIQSNLFDFIRFLFAYSLILICFDLLI